MPLRRLSRRLSPLLTAYLLLVSVGLPLQRVYCVCIGEAWLELPTESHQCNHVKTNYGHSVTVADAGHDCGDATVFFAQLDADFTTERDVLGAVDAGAVLPPPERGELAYNPAVMLRAAPIRGPSPPLATSGRSLLIAHQTFLI